MLLLSLFSPLIYDTLLVFSAIYLLKKQGHLNFLHSEFC